MKKAELRFRKEITFEQAKENHFYAQKNEKGQLELVRNPKIGEKYYEFACVVGGSDRPLILEIPIPLCTKHIKSHNNKPFFVRTCKEWIYLAIPSSLGSTVCRECINQLFVPMPFLSSANLSSADLSSANLSSANLNSADLRSANLKFANLRSADLSSANLSSANLIFANLNSADLRSANLNSADLRSANLIFANLRSADLSSANLSSANLRSADLSSANLSSADLRSADLSSAINIQYMYWNKFTLIDKEYKKLLNKDKFLI
jgi:hypothetical protein